MSEEQLELPPIPDPGSEEDIEDLESKQAKVLASVSSSKLDDLQSKVAWVLSRYPETRDSDVALYIRFWQELESEHVDGDSVRLRKIYKLTRPASLTRARAKLQNEYMLFLASDQVRKRRGTLAEGEREKALVQRPAFPMYTVYTDESGKTDDHLVVGALWFLHGPDVIAIDREVDSMASSRGAPKELHFKEITDSNLQFYKRIVDWLMERAGTISFTSVSLPRRGHKSIDAALATMHYHLLMRGIQHHDQSGRAPLPRSLTVFKDLEELGRDKLFLAELGDRLRQAASTLLDGNLYVDILAPVPSDQNVPIQLADLYTSSVARVLNAKGARSSARDKFADYFLALLGIPQGPQVGEQVGDLTMHVAI